jgi:hypothetical protein
MKRLIMIIALLAIFTPHEGMAQSKSNSKGFDYSSHAKMNKKAQRWKKRRMKAADGDQLNVQCSVRKSRRAARRAG